MFRASENFLGMFRGIPEEYIKIVRGHKKTQPILLLYFLKIYIGEQLIINYHYRRLFF